MSEENNTNAPVEQDKVEQQDPQQQPDDGLIPVEWESVKETYEFRKEQLRMQEYISRFLLETEKQKSDLLSRLSDIEHRVYELASVLRQQAGVDEDFAYELKLPENPGEKAFFIRKQ
tara:strand:- start:1536 stop:1886 length:351 start_codon:yes stop_codon:yes gene_type:complete